MVHTDNLGVVQSIEGCAECCIEPWHKDVHVLEKRRNAYIGWLRWRSVGKGSISWHMPSRKLRRR